MASLSVKVRHETQLSELGRRFTAFNRLTTAKVEQQPWRRWSRENGTSHSYDLQVVFFGKSGYGKSSLVNALSGLSYMETSDVAACTRVVQSVEYLVRQHTYLSLADLPGLGESAQHDAEYLALYRNIIDKADVVVYTLRADCRDYSIDLRAFRELFNSDARRQKLLIALNGCDRIEPIQRTHSTTPSTAQLLNIYAKQREVATVFSQPISRILPCSAVTQWGLSDFCEQLVSQLANSPGVSLS